MKYLKEHDAFLKKHETTPRKELTRLFNTNFKKETRIFDHQLSIKLIDKELWNSIPNLVFRMALYFPR